MKSKKLLGGYISNPIKQVQVFISLIILLAFFKSTLIIFGLYLLLFSFLFISTSFFFTNAIDCLDCESNNLNLALI